jgi:hypothetical protein
MFVLFIIWFIETKRNATINICSRHGAVADDLVLSVPDVVYLKENSCIHIRELYGI